MAYEKYYLTNEAIEEHLAKASITKGESNYQKILVRAKNAAEDLRWIDKCAHVSSDVPSKQFDHNQYSSAKTHAKALIDLLERISDISKFKEDFGKITQAQNELRSCMQNIRENMHLVVEFYELRSVMLHVPDLNSSARQLTVAFDELRSKFNALRDNTAQAYDQVKADYSALTQAADTDRRQAAEATKTLLSTFQNELKEAVRVGSELNERLKKDFETTQELNRRKAMSEFGTQFRAEAKNSTVKTWIATMLTCVVGLLLYLFLDHTHGLVASGAASPGPIDATTMWNLSYRIIVVGFLGWMFGHLLNERRNYSHLAAVNRHRANLCDAYIAVAPKMSEPERNQYLLTILPQLASVGSTGFIEKTNSPEMPAEALVKALVDKLPSK